MPLFFLFLLKVYIGPIKTNSACIQVKRSRKGSLSVPATENNDNVNEQIIHENHRTLHPLLKQPTPHVIDQSTAYLSPGQLSSLSCHSTIRFTLSSSKYLV